MELQNVFISAAVVLVAVIGVLAWLGGMNQAYGVQAGSSFNSTFVRVQTLINDTAGSMSLGVADNTRVDEGAGTGDQQDSLIEQSRSTLSLTGDLLGLIPDLMDDGASILGIPAVYVEIGKWVFWFVFGLTIAFILLLGVKRLLPGL